MNQKIVAEREINVHEKHGKCCFHCGISWKAIFSGAVVAVGLTFLLDLFGMGIGLSAYSVTTTQGEAKAFAYGGYIAIVLAGMIAMFIAGWVAGFIGRPNCINGCHGLLYGFITWCLALIISFLLLGYGTQYTESKYNTLTHAKKAEMNINANQNTSLISIATAHKADTTVKTEKEAKEEAKGFFLLFLLFIASALSAAFGGYTAVKRCRAGYRDPELNRDVHKLQ